MSMFKGLSDQTRSHSHSGHDTGMADQYAQIHNPDGSSYVPPKQGADWGQTSTVQLQSHSGAAPVLPSRSVTTNNTGSFQRQYARSGYQETYVKNPSSAPSGAHVTHLGGPTPSSSPQGPRANQVAPQLPPQLPPTQYQYSQPPQPQYGQPVPPLPQQYQAPSSYAPQVPQYGQPVPPLPQQYSTPQLPSYVPSQPPLPQQYPNQPPLPQQATGSPQLPRAPPLVPPQLPSSQPTLPSYSPAYSSQYPQPQYGNQTIPALPQHLPQPQLPTYPPATQQYTPPQAPQPQLPTPVPEPVRRPLPQPRPLPGTPQNLPVAPYSPSPLPPAPGPVLPPASYSPTAYSTPPPLPSSYSTPPGSYPPSGLPPAPSASFSNPPGPALPPPLPASYATPPGPTPYSNPTPGAYNTPTPASQPANQSSYQSSSSASSQPTKKKSKFGGFSGFAKQFNNELKTQGINLSLRGGIPVIQLSQDVSTVHCQTNAAPVDAAPPDFEALRIALEAKKNDKYVQIDDFARSFPEGPATQSIQSLPAALIDTPLITSPFEKARVLFYWIATHIKYDWSLFKSGSLQQKIEQTKPDYVLRTRTTICSGYAALFENFGRSIGLDVYVLSGLTYTSTEQRLQAQDSSHAWNAIKVDGNFFLLDCTWAAGNNDDDHVTDFFFMPPPDQLIFSHFPMIRDQPEFKWQLLPNPYSKQQWEALPHLSNGYFEGDYQMPEQHKTKIICVPYGSSPFFNLPISHGPATIPFVTFSYHAVTPEGAFISTTNLNERSLVQCGREPNISHIIVSPNQPGIYSIAISSSQTSDFIDQMQRQQHTSSKGSNVMEYQLNFTVEDGAAPVSASSFTKFPIAYSDAKLGNFYLISPLNGELRAHTTERFHVGQRENPWAYENSSLVMCKGKSPTPMLRAEDGTFYIDINVGSDDIMLGKLVANGGWSGLFTWRVVP